MPLSALQMKGNEQVKQRKSRVCVKLDMFIGHPNRKASEVGRHGA